MGSHPSKLNGTSAQPGSSRTAQFLHGEGIPLSKEPFVVPQQRTSTSVVSLPDSLYHDPGPLLSKPEPDGLVTADHTRSRLRLPWRKSRIPQYPAATVSPALVPPSPPASITSGSQDHITPEAPPYWSLSPASSFTSQSTSPQPRGPVQRKPVGSDASCSLRTTASSPILFSTQAGQRQQRPTFGRSSISQTVEEDSSFQPLPEETSEEQCHERQVSLIKPDPAASSIDTSISTIPLKTRCHASTLESLWESPIPDLQRSNTSGYTTPRRPSNRRTASHAQPFAEWHSPTSTGFGGSRKSPVAPEDQSIVDLDFALALLSQDEVRVDSGRSTNARKRTTRASDHAQNLQTQERLDRELAEQLQKEEDDDSRSASSPPRPRNAIPCGHSISWIIQPPSIHDPDEELARQLQEEEQHGPVGLPSYQKAQQEEADMLVARQLQDEEEDRIRQERATPRTRTCAVCGEDTPIPDFPAVVNCEHEPQVCAECYKGWIASELESKSWKEIKCPETGCKELLKHAEVQQYATLEVYTKFDQLSAREALNDDPNFRWCRSPACKSGQIHESGIEGNIFQCIDCGFRVCVVHDNAWHEGETCEEFDYRTSGKKERDQKIQEEASVKAIGELTKACPGKGGKCGWNIEKNEGCDHMTCTKCRYEFCWQCLADYNQIRKKGNSVHKESCKYHSSRIN